MNDQEYKTKIQKVLTAFTQTDLSSACLELFNVLGYDTGRRMPFKEKTWDYFNEFIIAGDPRFNKTKALVEQEWLSVDLLFQLATQDLQKAIPGFTRKVVLKDDKTRMAIESYLFLAVELRHKEYSRSTLAQITREVNKVFSMPVLIVFRYGSMITLSVINRRVHKKDERKDVLEKVTLIKDIDVSNPHRAHVEILFDLALPELQRKHDCANFVELHEAWQKTLDAKELNKKFYQQLSNWYFWAMENASFPADIEPNAEIRNAVNLIRLITRVIFVWFIKEKKLVPDVLFNKTSLKAILKDFLKNKSSHVYYNAILQNLFFAVLNQKMTERGFAQDGTLADNKNQYGVKNLFRYGALFAISEKEALALFRDVPFLNGGLFDCLDKPDDNGKIIYVDGFSRNPKKQAVVPDYLFFSDEQDIDLNEIYGSRNKRYKVRGLIDILSDFKFTVAENTPIEEEVALDPELLGKVFENLLASYNPETRTTARKQTGSFYTPREIVDYMVDESLIQYLKTSLLKEVPGFVELGVKQIDIFGNESRSKQLVIENKADISPWQGREDELESDLRKLVAYSDAPQPFDRNDAQRLLQAIDAVKILDPACGSGAFPMGILHKLVHILHKLDENNEQWKERQLRKARQLDDPIIRDKTIAGIESAFANNELDYGRKLFLIENCIYGVDIQPIAVQIAKLRFFISLIVDQKKQPEKDNLGILALPNLETKFVSANTLIGLEKPTQLSFRNPDVERLEKELKILRHQYFTAGSRREKLACQRKDKELRRKISEALVADGWGRDTAQQIADFDPYDQNSSSPFFDPEWMFGVTNGFDVVIGNPPYLESRHPSFRDHLKTLYQNSCKNRWGSDSCLVTRGADLLTYFFETSISIISPSGVIVFITQNAWLDTEYGIKIQNFLLKHTNVLQIIDSEYRYFPAGEGPNINTVITVFKGNKAFALNTTSFCVLRKNVNEIDTKKFHNILDNADMKVNAFSYSDGRLLKYKWGVLLNSDSFLLDLFDLIEEKATTLNKIPNYFNTFYFGQGLNLLKTCFVPADTLRTMDVDLKQCVPILYSGSPFFLNSTDWYLVRKGSVEKTIERKLHSNGYSLFDQNATRKKSPALIMPRGVSKHFCCLNNISAFSLSCVDVYNTDSNTEDQIVFNLWCYFNSSLFWLLREISGRKNLGGGLLKSEAADLTNFPVYLDLNFDFKNVIPNFQRNALETLEELKTKEHQLLDKIIFDYLGLATADRVRCVNYLCKAIQFRSERAK